MLNLFNKKSYKSFVTEDFHQLIEQASSFFDVPLIDLGTVESRQFAGVLAPQPEVGARKEGVDSVFLEGAETYYEKYQSFDYWHWCIKGAIERAKINSARLIVEFGSGFGNSTLPLLSIFPDAHVVATDISPNQLSILKRLLEARNQRQRCSLMQMDAQKKYLKANIADLVVGSAILHHLREPKVFIERAMEILKPGGCAVFFEPFEAGYSILRLICIQISEEAKRRGESTPALDYIAKIPEILAPQIYRDNLPGWKDLNDKWAFPCSVLENIKKETNAEELIIYPLHDNNKQFTRHITYMLKDYAQITGESLPRWAFELISRFEENYFSKDMLEDLIIEGCIIFKKSKAPISDSCVSIANNATTLP